MVIGEYMGAVFLGHFIKGFTAALWLNNGIRALDGDKVFLTGQPAGTDDIRISDKAWMKG
jgi:hypothetical protein